MVIEYIGTIIRNEVANRKEKLYESQVRVVFVDRFFPLSPVHTTKAGAVLPLGGFGSPHSCFLLRYKCSGLKIQPEEPAVCLTQGSEYLSV